MGFTKDTYQITIQRLTADGQGGFWWVDYDSNTRVRRVGYADSGKIETVANLVARDTFRDLMELLISNNVALPVKDVGINLEEIADTRDLYDQFRAPALSNSECQAIANAYNVVDFLSFFGVLPLVARFYRLGLVTLGQLADILINMGQALKITRQKAVNITDTLLAAGDITEQQRDNFLTRWDNEVA